MYLSIIITVIIAFILSVLIIKLLSKTFKLLVFLVIFVIVFGILYFGYDAFTDKFKQWGKQPLDVEVVSQSSGCTSDFDCAFVISPSDCDLVADSCNNIKNPSKFLKPDKAVKCSIDFVVLNPDIRCFCKKTPTASYCEKL